MTKLSTLRCSKCGAETLAEYELLPDGERTPTWQCLNIDCGYTER